MVLTTCVTDEDLAALTLLTNAPYYYLLHSFWSIQLLPVLISLGIDITIITLPFALLRARPRVGGASTPNQAITTDYQILLVTSALAAAIYAVTFYLSYYLNLGVFLITHFDSIPSLETAHDPSLPYMLALFSLSGIAAMQFLFRPTFAAAGKPVILDSPVKTRRTSKRFQPATATLGETFAYNLGYGETGWSHRAEVLAKRTAVLVVCALANTVVRVFGTVEGTDLAGALGYAGIWVLAHVGVGVGYGWLGQET